MAGRGASGLPWRVQWHVTADGTVIQQRSRGDQLHEQLFQSFATTRPVTVADLDRLSQSSEREFRRVTPFGVVWFTGLAVFVGGCIAAGGLLTRQVSGNVIPGLIVGAVLAAVLAGPVFKVVMALMIKLLPGDHGVGSVERLWSQAGLASMTGVTMAAAEASAQIAAPGTTSGVVTRAGRA